MSTHPPHLPLHQHHPQHQHQHQPSQSKPQLPPPNRKRKSSTITPPASKSNNNTGGISRQPTKRLPSCDLCRARKVKCVKTNNGNGFVGDDRCEGCVGLNQRCEYTHERRKPGPANSFARKSPPPRQDSQYHHRNPSYLDPPPPQPPYNHHAQAPSNPLDIFPETNSNPAHNPNHNSNHNHNHNGSSIPSIFSPNIPFDPSNPFSVDLEPTTTSSWPPDLSAPPQPQLDLPFLPISPSALLYPVAGEVESSDGSPAGPWPWGNASSGWDATDLAAGPSGSGATGNSNGNANGSGGGLNFSVGGWDPPPASNQTMSSASQVERPTSAGGLPRKTSFVRQAVTAKSQKEAKIQRLEEVLEWSTMMRILHAYHAHLYPLLPIVHWPSFSQQLIARDYERSDVWRAFILSLVAYSIIQLPRSSLTFIPVPELRRIHQKCHSESRKLQNRRYTSVSLVDITTLYCQHIYLGTLGKTNAANVTLAEAIRLSHVLSLHDERINSGTMDVVEREMRRRTFWLLYGSDRTITALTSDPMHIYDADLCLPLPLSLDDNLLTPLGAFPQPPNTTPVLAGFHYNTRLLRLLGAVLTAHRASTASWRDPELDPFAMFSLPPPPKEWLRPSSHFLEELERILVDLPGPLQLVNPNGGEQPSPNGSSVSENPPRKDGAAFATCRANLLVTQALVRFAIRQYAKSNGEDDIGESGRDWAEKDVLGLLESMSAESLAANGDSLRAKVLFVASSLLEKYPSTTEGHSYVSDFLNVYTRISQEQHVSLLEPDRSGEVSREDSPVVDGQR